MMHAKLEPNEGAKDELVSGSNNSCCSSSEDGLDVEAGHLPATRADYFSCLGLKSPIIHSITSICG